MEPGGMASSVYSLYAANELVNQVLNFNAAEVHTWMADPKPSRKGFEGYFNGPTETLVENSGSAYEVQFVLVVLQKPAPTLEGFSVLSAFPIL